MRAGGHGGDELRRRGIPFRRGAVLAATESRYAVGVVEALGVLGLDCQLIRNRSALMVLPAGVTTGKSHVIGLMVERWILAGYGVLVLAPEGDHTELKQLDNVVHVDSRHYLPEPFELLDALHPSTSSVADLSALTLADKCDYVQRLRVSRRGQP